MLTDSVHALPPISISMVLHCLEVAENLGVVGDGGLAVSTMSSLNQSSIELELGLGF